MSTRPAAPILADLFAATPLAIFANALREILQSRSRASVATGLASASR
jgi:hypothetical protein